MTDLELNALLDVHDSLVRSYMDSTLSFEQFLALYNNFPHAYALSGDDVTAAERAVLQRSQRRIAFHFQIAGVLSGLSLEADSVSGPSEEAERFAPAVGLMRLRALLTRYPEFKAESHNLA